MRNEEDRERFQNTCPNNMTFGQVLDREAGKQYNALV